MEMKAEHDHTRGSLPGLPFPETERVWQDTARRSGWMPPCTRRAGLPLRAPASRSAGARVASGFTLLQTSPRLRTRGPDWDAPRVGSPARRRGVPTPASPLGGERSRLLVPTDAGCPQNSVRPFIPAFFHVDWAPCPTPLTTKVCLHWKRFPRPYDSSALDVASAWAAPQTGSPPSRPNPRACDGQELGRFRTQPRSPTSRSWLRVSEIP